MPKCLFRYQWVKLPRTHLPVGKGIMGYWAKLASRAAFRKGRAKYCGYTADQHYTFGESDAWLDLWCHTVWQETGNAFSYLAPAVQFGRLGAALTLEALGRRWGWEKTKVWRFFQKNGDAFALHRLPGSYGCLIFNKLYPTDTEVSLPSYAELERIIEEMRICAGNTHIAGSDNMRLNKMCLWYSRGLITQATDDRAEQSSERRVAFLRPIIRAYFSLCRNCQNCIYDCGSVDSIAPRADAHFIRGPCTPTSSLYRLSSERNYRHERKGDRR